WRQRGRRRRLALGLRIVGRLGLAWSRSGQARPLLLELHAQPGELPLDLPNRLLAFVEPLPLGLGEGELLHGLALTLLGLGDGAGELVGAIESERCGGCGRAPPTLPAGDLEA